MAGGPVNGSPRILLAEDDFLVAMDLENVLAAHGWRVIGPAATVSAALASIEQEPPDVAVLDVNLAGQRAGPIAVALNARGVPFVLVSGYADFQLPEAEFADAVRVPKPCDAKLLVRVIGELLG